MTRPSPLQGLIDQWRARANVLRPKPGYVNDIGEAYDKCANELEALLTAEAATLREKERCSACLKPLSGKVTRVHVACLVRACELLEETTAQKDERAIRVSGAATHQPEGHAVQRPAAGDRG